MKQLQQFVVQIGEPFGHHIDDNYAHVLLQITGALHGEHAAMAGTVFVGRTYQLDGRHDARTFFVIKDLNFEAVHLCEIQRHGNATRRRPDGNPTVGTVTILIDRRHIHFDTIAERYTGLSIVALR